jgi:hypothetical protein
VGVYWEIVYFDSNKTDTQKQDPWVNNKKRTNGSTKIKGLMGQQKITGPLGQNKSLRAAINNKVKKSNEKN